MRRIEVFISSTMEDMQKERETVKTALQRLDFIEPIFAESFPAQPRSPKEICLDEVKNSHIYVGIFKDRYGWVPQEENPDKLSVTAIEYQEAVRNDIPTLVFVHENDSKRDKGLKEFLAKISDFDKGFWRKEYGNLQNLQQLVCEAIKADIVRNYINTRRRELREKIELFYRIGRIVSQKEEFEEEIKVYIPRKVSSRTEYYKYSEYFDLLFITESFSLIDKLKTHKRIVLLGDAGFGKTIELKKIALDLIKTRDENILPVFTTLNTYVNEDIGDYLNIMFSDRIFDFNQSSLLFIFDEFDLVKDKSVATRKIKQFIDAHNKASFVIGSRTNFYSEQFSDYDFETYILLPFSHDEIKRYASTALESKGNSREFLVALNRNNLFGLVFCQP